MLLVLDFIFFFAIIIDSIKIIISLSVIDIVKLRIYTILVLMASCTTSWLNLQTLPSVFISLYWLWKHVCVLNVETNWNVRLEMNVHSLEIATNARVVTKMECSARKIMMVWPRSAQDDLDSVWFIAVQGQDLGLL